MQWIVTDVGSAKGCVIESVRSAAPHIEPRFVPGHPIAGTEHSGVEASLEGLYRGRRVILTPTSVTQEAAASRVKEMWKLTGADVTRMDAEHHDQVLAATSHLPHMLAYTLMDVLGHMHDRVEIFQYAAGGLRDFTRVASSDPQMWHDICIHNREALLAMIDDYQGGLALLRRCVDHGDGRALHQLFTRAKGLRDKHVVGEQKS